jgi:hypothetical protein
MLIQHMAYVVVLRRQSLCYVGDIGGHSSRLMLSCCLLAARRVTLLDSVSVRYLDPLVCDFISHTS